MGILGGINELVSLQDSNPPPHVLLVFPPVWVPMVPHLALPALSAYLREHKVRVTALDANLEFFVDHLLSPPILSSAADRVRAILAGRRDPSIPPAWLRLAQRELPSWEASVAELEGLLSAFRSEEVFFSADEVLRAQDQLQGLLLMCSLAQWPGRISFNHYRRGDIQTAQDLLDLCQDPERNVFMPFWRDRVLPRIREASPVLVGISISSIHQFIAGLTLARLIRQEMPGVHVVLGGKHILRIQEKLLEHPFYFRDFIHSAIVHEGEGPLLALVEVLTTGHDLHRVPNLILMEANRPVATRLADPPPLETLPIPDFRDVPWGQYLVPRRYAPIRMSEGCYWGKCAFCARYGHERLAYFPPERVMDGMAQLRESHGIRDFSVNDDCMPPEYWDDLCAGIHRQRLDLSMCIWAKPVAGFTPKRLQRMAQAGVRQIRWGVESGHPRVLKRMRKGTTVGTTLRVLGHAHEAGIWNHACFIVGFPTETRQEAEATLDLIRSHRAIIQSFILYPFVLYEHSAIFGDPEAFGIRDLQAHATPFFDRFSYTTHGGMAPGEVQALVRQAKGQLLKDVYGWPFWYYLKLREYLQLYLDRYGLEGTASMPFRREGLRRTWEGLGP
jgi:radical SAM superfamily enzyme YgiQ (UPF0313 family)